MRFSRRSSVWEFFISCENESKAECQHCHHKILQGRDTMSFMINHPQSSHNKEYKKHEEEKRVLEKSKVLKKSSHCFPDGSGNEHVFGVILSQASDNSQLYQKLTELAFQRLFLWFKIF